MVIRIHITIVKLYKISYNYKIETKTVLYEHCRWEEYFRVIMEHNFFCFELHIKQVFRNLCTQKSNYCGTHSSSYDRFFL